MDKEELLNELNESFNYFSKVKSSYETYIGNYAKLASLKQPSLFLWMITGVASGGLLFILFSLLTNIEEFLLLIVFICFMTFSIMLLRWLSHLKKIRVLKKGMSESEKIIKSHYSGKENCILAIEYTNPEVILTLENLLRSGRADTLKEAINTMIDDYRHNQILANQSNLIKAQNLNTATLTAIGFFLAGHNKPNI